MSIDLSVIKPAKSDNELKTKLEPRLKIMLGSIFVISALAIIATASLPFLNSHNVGYTSLDVLEETGGFTTLLNPDNYQLENINLPIKDFNFVNSAKSSLILKSLKITGDEGRAVSGILDFNSYEKPTGLFKMSFQQKGILESNNVELMVRGSAKIFSKDDENLSWYKLDTTEIGDAQIIVDQIPQTITNTWKYLQIGFELKKTEGKSPEVTNPILQTATYKGNVESKCSDGPIIPLSECSCGIDSKTSTKFVPSKGFCFNNKWQLEVLSENKTSDLEFNSSEEINEEETNQNSE